MTIMVAAQVWSQRAKRQILQDCRCVIWASYLAMDVPLCGRCFRVGVQRHVAKRLLRRRLGQLLPCLAPGKHCIQCGAQGLAPWREAVIHLGRDLCVDGAQHQAVAF